MFVRESLGGFPFRVQLLTAAGSFKAPRLRHMFVSVVLRYESAELQDQSCQLQRSGWIRRPAQQLEV